MNVRLKPPQWTVFCCQRRFRLLAAGRRFGKTFLALVELCRAAWGAGRTAWYVAPTYKQAKRVAWQTLKQLTRPYWAAPPNETDLTITLLVGGTISLRGVDRYDSLRGHGLDFLVLDEFASMAPEAWSAVLRPMLSDRQGKALFIGTPRGHNHFFDLYEAAQSQPQWAAFQFTTAEGGHVAAEELQAATLEMDARTYRQEFEARFENLGAGIVYYAFDRHQNVRPTEYNPSLPLYWSLDFNIHPMCSVIAQIEDYSCRADLWLGRQLQRVNVLDELYLPDSNTLAACEEFVQRTQFWTRQGHGPLQVYCYGDASGRARQTAGAGAPSDWETVRQFFARRAEYRFAFHYQQANPAVKDRMAAVNAMLCNAQGERRLFLDPRCQKLIRDLERVSWKPGSSLLDKHTDPLLTHVSDALGYLLETEFGLRPWIGARPQRLI